MVNINEKQQKVLNFLLAIFNKDISKPLHLTLKDFELAPVYGTCAVKGGLITTDRNTIFWVSTIRPNIHTVNKLMEEVTKYNKKANERNKDKNSLSKEPKMQESYGVRAIIVKDKYITEENIVIDKDHEDYFYISNKNIISSCLSKRLPFDGEKIYFYSSTASKDVIIKENQYAINKLTANIENLIKKLTPKPVKKLNWLQRSVKYLFRI
jgi:hypothetical protein